MRNHSKNFITVFAILFIFALAIPAQSLTRDEMLDQGYSSDEAYSHMLVKKAEQDPAMKNELLNEALSVSPDSPAFYFKLAWANLPGITHMIEGFKAYKRNFWWLRSLQGLIYISLISSLLIALLIAALMRLPRELPLMVHDVNDNRKKLLLPLLALATAAFGVIPFIAGLLFISSFYLKKRNKVGVYIALLLVITSPVTLSLANRLYSTSTPIMRAIVDVNERRDNVLALEALANRDDFASKFSYATALKRAERPLEAIAIFNGLAQETNDSRVLNNLGNAFIAVGDTESAKKAYEDSIAIKRTVTNLYNLGQYYRDGLDFDNGTKYYNEANAINSTKVSSYTSKMGKHPNRLVMDESLTMLEMSKLNFGTSQLKVFTHKPIIPAAYALFLMLIFAIADSQITSRAFRCKKCGKVTCMICSEGNKLCPECQGNVAQDNDSSARTRVKQMLSANHEKQRHMNIIRALSFTPPGIAQMYSGRVFQGLFIAWMFIFSVFIMVMDPMFTTGLGGDVHSWLRILMIPFAIILYYISFVTVNRRLDRGWL